MMLRLLTWLASLAAAYALLRGWPAGLPPLVRGCVAVLILAAGTGLWAWRGRRPAATAAEGSPRRRATRWDFLSVAWVGLTLESAVLWWLCAAPPSLELAAIRLEQTFRPAAAAARQNKAAPGAPRGGNWLWTDETSRPLPLRTDFKPGNRPEIFLRLQDFEDVLALQRQSVFVRSFTLGSYRRNQWRPLELQKTTLRADRAGWIRLDPQEMPPPPQGILHEVFHATDPAGQNVFSALQGAFAAEIPRLTRLGPSGLHLLPDANDPGGYRYLASSRPLGIGELPADADLRPWPGAHPELLAPPADPELAGLLERLAREAGGAETLPLATRLHRLREWLISRHRYSLRTDNPRGIDPLLNFLLHEKRGHCEFFASAGVLMARALGVPARMAYGWAGGAYHESSGLFVFRARDAHAWAEVWIENHGWAVMDCTPPGREAADPAEQEEENPRFASTPNLDSGESSDSEGTAGDPAAPAAWLLAGSLLSCVGLFGWRACRAAGSGFSHSRVSSRESHPPPLPGYWHSWEDACRQAGLAPAAAGRTLRRQLAEWPEAAPDFAQALLEYHYATRYAGQPPDPATERRLQRAIRQWTRRKAAAR